MCNAVCFANPPMCFCKRTFFMAPKSLLDRQQSAKIKMKLLISKKRLIMLIAIE